VFVDRAKKKQDRNDKERRLPFTNNERNDDGNAKQNAIKVTNIDQQPFTDLASHPVVE
jgi:hypothetical protein